MTGWRWVDELALVAAPFLPPAFGAFLGLRWVKDQTPFQRVTGFVGSFGIGVYGAPAIAEHVGLGPNVTVAIGILLAVIGMDLIGGLMRAAQKFREDPLGCLKEWVPWWKRSS